MNGRRSFARMKRDAVREWKHEQNDNKSMFHTKEFQEIFLDSVRFYVHLQQHEHSNYTLTCEKKWSLLNHYTNKSHVWRFIMAHTLDGILELRKGPISCAPQMNVHENIESVHKTI